MLLEAVLRCPFTVFHKIIPIFVSYQCWHLLIIFSHSNWGTSGSWCEEYPSHSWALVKLLAFHWAERERGDPYSSVATSLGSCSGFSDTTSVCPNPEMWSAMLFFFSDFFSSLPLNSQLFLSVQDLPQRIVKSDGGKVVINLSLVFLCAYEIFFKISNFS